MYILVLTRPVPTSEYITFESFVNYGIHTLAILAYFRHLIKVTIQIPEI